MSAFSWMSLRGRSSRRRADRRRGRVPRFAPGVVGLEGRLLLSGVVTNTDDSGPGSFRDVVTNAPPDATITFAPGVVGTITLTSGPVSTPFGQNLSIDGPGASKLTVSGGGNSQILLVGGPNPGGETVNVSGLTFSDGNAPAGTFGGAIMDAGAMMTISKSAFVNNHADGLAGAVVTFPGSTLNLDHDQFTGNTAGVANPASAYGDGGAIYCNGTATVSSSVFTGNLALGSSADGGAIVVGYGSTLTVTGSTFANNQAVGSGYGQGGAIYGSPTAVLTIDSTRFLANLAQGGLATGGAIDATPANSSNPPGPLTTTITNSLFSGNRAAGTSGGTSGGSAEGGSIANGGGILALSGSTLVDNQAIGGGGGVFGGPSSGGAVYAAGSELNFASDKFLHDVARGGSAPQAGGFALGGAVDSFGGLQGFTGALSTVANSLFLDNSALAGTGGSNFNLDYAYGGALVVGPNSPATITASTFVGNRVQGSDALNGGVGGVADGGAIMDISSAVTVAGGLIAGNTAVGGTGGRSASGVGGAGGTALGGGIDNEGGTLNVSAVTILGNVAQGGAGGHGTTAGGMGGIGEGGGIASDTTLVVTGGLISFNLAAGGDGGGGTTPGDDGEGLGGGVAVLVGTGTLPKSRVRDNHASTSDDNVYGTVTYT